MRAVWLDVPEWFLAERRQLGHDRKDELWDGVLHMVPPAGSFEHALVINHLCAALDAIGKRRRMHAFSSELAVFDHDNNYRIPDVTISRSEHRTKQGLIGAELVVEVLSPNDESREKQPFYAARGIRESWIVEPFSRAHEVYELRRGRYVRVRPVGAITRSPLLGIELSIVKGPLLRLVDGAHVASV